MDVLSCFQMFLYSKAIAIGSLACECSIVSQSGKELHCLHCTNPKGHFYLAIRQNHLSKPLQDKQ